MASTERHFALLERERELSELESALEVARRSATANTLFAWANCLPL